MIRLTDVHKSFGAQTVLNGLNLSIPAGQITAIIGPSGEGKSVLIKHMIGLLQPDSGRIEVDGENLADLHLGAVLHREDRVLAGDARAIRRRDAEHQYRHLHL